MAARKASSRTAITTPQRKTRGQRKGKEVDSTPSKNEDGISPRANMSVKRSSSANTPVSTRSSKRVKVENEENKENIDIKDVEDDDSALSDAPSYEFSETSDVESRSKQQKKRNKSTTTPTKNKKRSPQVKSESDPKSADKKAATLQARKLQSYAKTSGQSPFPDFKHPTAEEAKLAHKILSDIHGKRVRPEKVVASTTSAGCGDSPSVLDALVRTILSQNTSDKNSTRAKLAMDKAYGGSDQWDVIVEGGEDKLREVIRPGGLSQVKAKVIMSILHQAKEKYGKYSLDHLFDASDEEAMTEMLAFQGVGPKTASCVLLFCLQRESFAVDTHVYRIAGLLGWRPKNATRDETHAHLDVRIPDEDKYGLHILMVTHGKKCEECKAGGKNVGQCELRKAFRKGKLDGEAGDDIKAEEKAEIKKERQDGSNSAVKGEAKVKEEDWESGQEDYVHGMQGTKKNTKKVVGNSGSKESKAAKK